MGKSLNLWSNHVCCLEKYYMSITVKHARLDAKVWLNCAPYCSNQSKHLQTSLSIRLATLPFVDTKVLGATLGDGSS